MTDAPKISLNQQLEAVRFACERARVFAQGHAVKPMRGKSAEEYDFQRLMAAARTMEWLKTNHAELVDFLALPKEARATAIAMGQQLAHKQTVAAAGGPVR